TLFFAGDGHVGGSCHVLLSLLDKCLFWQEIASWLARELSKVVPENILLIFSTTYMNDIFIWILS
ncbi:hypothetical protein, partial [Pseudomonas entomophila]|uniref:hypothetical protein n=1 Tax=Pseudomonas entomophila TaxID=312306 RepID=UPI001F0181C4